MSIYNAVTVALEVLLHLSERHAGFGNAPLEVISIMCGNTSPLFLWSYWDFFSRHQTSQRNVLLPIRI
jgi:hypothetical protein